MNKYTRRAEEYFKSHLSFYNFQKRDLIWSPSDTHVTFGDKGKP